MQKDPVCDMSVAPELAAGQRQLQGQTWHLCSPACVAPFDQAPQHDVLAERARSGETGS